MAEMDGIVEEIRVRHALIADERAPNRPRQFVLLFLPKSSCAQGCDVQQCDSEQFPRLSSNAKHALAGG